MTTLLLSAGQATRMADHAPAGCKAMAIVGGRTMVDWWRDVDPLLVVVCRTEHVSVLPDDLELRICDEGGGAAVALQKALEGAEAPITVVYGDTWVPAASVPSGVDWCGVAAGAGGRSWDVVDNGLFAYEYVEPTDAALVAIGLYRFADLTRLGVAVDDAIDNAQAQEIEAGMADVVNFYGCSLRPVFGWQDVGDPAALAAWRLV